METRCYLPLCLSYAFIHSLVINWLIRAVFPTPLAPSIATVYEDTSFGGAERFSSFSGSAGAKEFDLDLLLLKESPLLMTPVTERREIDEILIAVKISFPFLIRSESPISGN